MFSSTKKSDFSSAEPSSNLVWIDLEMTGLDPEVAYIIEIACVITDADLNIIATSPDLIIHQSKEVLERMNEWCQRTHRETGLYDEVLKSTLTVTEAEERILDFVRQYAEPKTCPLAGNSVYMDRLFLAKYMPALEQYLHPQIVDATCIKELCRRWRPDVYANVPQKKLVHRAASDIEESIEEYKFYKNAFFNVKNS